MRALTKFFITITILGAINWGLVGFFNWNLINAVFGYAIHDDLSVVSRIIYAIVGLCGIGLAAAVSRLEETAPRRVRPPIISKRTDVPV
jgi:uncharacterized membrane protein YuzA (DUF378 family)